MPPGALVYDTPLDIELSGEFADKWQLLQTFDLKLRWSAVFYAVSWNRRMVGSFVPNKLSLELMHGLGDPQLFWDPAKKNKRKAKADEPAAWATVSDCEQGTDSSGGEGADEMSENSSAGHASSDSDVGSLFMPDECVEGAGADGDVGDGGARVGGLGDAGDGVGELDVLSSGESVQELEALVAQAMPAPDGGGGAGGGAASNSSASSSTSSSSSSSLGSSSGGEASEHVSEECVVEDGLDDDEPAMAAGARLDTFQLTPWCHMTFFQKADRRDFIMKCRQPGHEQCIVTRSANSAKHSWKVAQGRPLGLFAALAFEAHARPADFPDKRSHARDFKPSHATRAAARQRLAGMVGSAYYFRQERACRPGEADEPDQIP